MNTSDIQKAIEILKAQLADANTAWSRAELELIDAKGRVKYFERSIASLRKILNDPPCIHCGQPEGNHAQKDDACPTSDFYSDSQRFEVRQ